MINKWPETYAYNFYGINGGDFARMSMTNGSWLDINIRGADVMGACGIGMGGTIILLVMVAAAVGIFLMTGMRGKQYEYLENLDIDTAYGVSGMAKERRAQYAEKHSRLLIVTA